MIASHPGPSLVISTIVVALAAAAGASATSLLLLTPAALAAQLSIGWSNDAFDASKDIASGRRDKPIARGTSTRRSVMGAALIALSVSVVTAFALGVSAGLVNVAMIGLGWAYNAGLKSSPLSGVLYLLGFGLIPVLSTSVLPGHPLPQAYAVVAAALLGLGAHFVNALPDMAGDLVQRVNGLPQLVYRRHGPHAVRLIAFVLLLVASAVIVSTGRSGWPAITVSVVNLALAMIGLRAPGRVPFLIAMLIAAIDAALLVFAGNDLVRS